MEIANTTIAILRGKQTNAFGDKVAAPVAVYSGVPACIIENSHNTQDPASQTPRTIRVSTGVVSGYTDVLANDTVKNERTGDFFMVISLERKPGLIGEEPDKVLTLRSRSGLSASTD